MTIRYARLKPGCRHYPSLDSGTSYRILHDEEPSGFWIEGCGIGDSFLTPDSRFVFAHFFDVIYG